MKRSSLSLGVQTLQMPPPQMLSVQGGTFLGASDAHSGSTPGLYSTLVFTQQPQLARQAF